MRSIHEISTEHGWNISPFTTKEMFKVIIKSIYDEVDSGAKDGELDVDEFKQFVLYILDVLQNIKIFKDGENLKHLFQRYDTNQDGILSWEEAWGAIGPLYEQINGEFKTYTIKTNHTPEQFKEQCREMF